MIGHGIVHALALVNNLKVNEDVLYARVTDVEQRSARGEEAEMNPKIPALQTERLVLHPLTGSDADALHRISNDPMVRRYLWDDEPVSRARIEEVVAQSARMFSEEDLGLFGVRLRGSQRLVGFCGFVRLEGMEEPELGYELLPELWGSGLATEAARACVRHAFEEAGLERVIAGADASNGASLRVIEKLGMKRMGNMNPHARDEPYYFLRREDFFASKTGGHGFVH